MSYVFLGRLLASQGGITLWAHHERPSYLLHMIDRGLTLELEAEAAANLLAVLQTGLAASAQPEAEKDVERRLQILRARVTDYIRHTLAQQRGTADSES